ncbi:hypothetical protein MMC25_007363 [Agyrium rufum]|nr:hypothetical protein [Agyrium rufum]
MAPSFANHSCDPFTPTSKTCTFGTYVQYVVNATDALDYQETISCIRKYNICLVVRNTGHGYIGKSTAAGAITIWTHHIEGIAIIEYESPHYQGKAIRLGAGVQAFEAYNAAQQAKMIVIGGICPTVGISGEYSQGRGHGPLASRFGLAADQVLEWEVVTAASELIVASPIETSDLYWALTGGWGGGHLWSRATND